MQNADYLPSSFSFQPNWQWFCVYVFPFSMRYQSKLISNVSNEQIMEVNMVKNE